MVLDLPTGVGPDIVYVSTERMVDRQHDGFHGVPDLLGGRYVRGASASEHVRFEPSVPAAFSSDAGELWLP